MTIQNETHEERELDDGAQPSQPVEHHGATVSHQPVVVENKVVIESGNRPYQIVATLLLCAAVGMIAYSLALNGWLEIASTILTMFFVQLVTLMFKHGLLAVPKGSSDEFAGTKGFVQTAMAEYRAWEARSPIWRLTAIAATYTTVFMTLRFAMSRALLVFSNVWIAGAGAALLASLIIFPNLIPSVIAATKRTGAVKSAPNNDQQN